MSINGGTSTPAVRRFLRERGRPLLPAHLRTCAAGAIAILAESGQPDAAIAASLDARSSRPPAFRTRGVSDAALRPASAAHAWIGDADPIGVIPGCATERVATQIPINAKPA